jgi:hypothetical protein
MLEFFANITTHSNNKGICCVYYKVVGLDLSQVMDFHIPISSYTLS